MLTTYIEAALGRAATTQLVEDSTYFAEIPGFPGVWANAATLDNCMEQLREVLEDWIVLQLRSGDLVKRILRNAGILEEYEKL